jgi:hypothetical protein
MKQFMIFFFCNIAWLLSSNIFLGLCKTPRKSKLRASRKALDLQGRNSQLLQSVHQGYWDYAH